MSASRNRVTSRWNRSVSAMKTPPSLSCTLSAAASRSNSAGLDSMMCIQQRILGRWIRVDHRLPLVGGAVDVGVLELPVEDVLDEVVGGLDVAGLADGDPDGLVAGEAGEQELVVPAAEERREPREDLDGVRVPVRPHHLLDHAEEVLHDLLLAVAERLVLEEEEADGEPVLDVVDAEQRVRGLADHRGEERERRRQQLVVRRLLERLEQGREARPGEEREVTGHGAGVGEVLALRERPRGHVQVVAHALVARGEHRPVQLEVGRRQRRTGGGSLHEVAHQRVALEERRRALRQEPAERAGQTLERLVVLLRVVAGQHVRRPREQRPQQQRELVGGEAGLEQPHDELGEQAEQLRPALRALEVRPVAQQRGLEPVDQRLGVAERVEVLAHRVRERGAHAVQAVDRLEQRQVPVGDDDLLRRVGEVGAERLGVERYGPGLHDPDDTRQRRHASATEPLPRSGPAG